MPSAAKIFFLAVFALLGTTHASLTDDNQSELCSSYAALDASSPHVEALTQDTDFFSHYRLNLYNKKCPFWSEENDMCGNIACSVNTLENEQDIPLAWRAEELGKLTGPKAHHPGRSEQRARPSQRPLQGELGDDVGESCVVEYDDECDERDYCVPEDEGASAKGDYVSLINNPERFTGYSGAGPRQVWDAMYRENCFPTASTSSGLSLSNPTGLLPGAKAADELLSVMKQYNIQSSVKEAIAKGAQTSASSPIDELEFDQDCVEKRVFHRIVSGMHASISSQICSEYLNQTTGEWGPNVDCYKTRLQQHPERISNLNFNYALLRRAVDKLRHYLQSYIFCSADPIQNHKTKQLVHRLSESIQNQGNITFDERIMFQSPDAAGLKDEFKQRFRNISRIMDCVGCDKCRLWGKIQINGYGAALKVLFEFDEDTASLGRTELVALINTLDRVGRSLKAVKYFERVIAEANGSDKATDGQSSLPCHNTDRPPGKKNNPILAQETLSQLFWAEVNLVWFVLKFVIKSWFQLPGKIIAIIIDESQRFYYSFLGFNAPVRTWGFKFTYDRDEL